MEITIRKFKEEDIRFKVQCINNSENNQYLHYDLPLDEDKTLNWFNSIKNNSNREDYTIIYDEEPAGFIGLLNIDYNNRKAEFYIVLSGEKFKGKGIATSASKLLIQEGYYVYNLNKMYLFTETSNKSAQTLFERVGFKKEGILKEDLIYRGKKIDRIAYGLLFDNYLDEEK